MLKALHSEPGALNSPESQASVSFLLPYPALLQVRIGIVFLPWLKGGLSELPDSLCCVKAGAAFILLPDKRAEDTGMRR